MKKEKKTVFELIVDSEPKEKYPKTKYLVVSDGTTSVSTKVKLTTKREEELLNLFYETFTEDFHFDMNIAICDNLEERNYVLKAFCI